MMNEPASLASDEWSMKANVSNSYQLTTLSNQIRQPTREATLIGAIFAFVFIVFGLIGNIIVITTILSVKKLRSNIINSFIVSVSYS